jgi:hypothetical protein
MARVKNRSVGHPYPAAPQNLLAMAVALHFLVVLRIPLETGGLLQNLQAMEVNHHFVVVLRSLLVMVVVLQPPAVLRSLLEMAVALHPRAVLRSFSVGLLFPQSHLVGLRSHSEVHRWSQEVPPNSELPPHWILVHEKNH